MADAFIIETPGGVTAGIAVLEERDVRFYASRSEFYPLEGCHFIDVHAVHRAVGKLQRPARHAA